jgi:hypothetical protein
MSDAKNPLQRGLSKSYYLAAGLPDGVHICKPKIPICIYFGGLWNGKCWYI